MVYCEDSYDVNHFLLSSLRPGEIETFDVRELLHNGASSVFWDKYIYIRQDT